ncbi:hypothetical protein FH972_022175 [Carpinus fangiana]|uniref:Guanine deaminase n=1 Tax=Carpinus fangiana TaxID=176857 RepID=A0A5N6KTN9_9ROSI|nr:hypothetical protein FH972_022175 [Carpinus fangiana]
MAVLATKQEDPKRTVYYGTFIHTPSPTLLEVKHNCAVGVDVDSRIAFIEECPNATAIPLVANLHAWDAFDTVISDELSPGRSNFFFPGLIDTHTHASQYPNAGIFGNSTLLDWLNTYTFPLEGSFSSLDRAKHVYNRVVHRSLSHGTTAAAYYATVHVSATNLLADVCQARGQRALVGRVCMDRMSPETYRDESTESALRDTQACIDHCASIDPSGSLIRPVITPRFAPSCTVATLNALGELHQRTKHFVQTHISENHSEIELVKELFPKAKDYASVYDDAGLLSERTILAHAVHLTKDEIDLVGKRGTGVSHCPTSNTCITSGEAPVRKLLEAGIPVGLGTDVSGGYSPSILDMARHALLVSRHIAMREGPAVKLDISEALYLATMGGAKVMGLEGVVGKFEIGMEFDAMLVGLAHCQSDNGPEEASGENSEAVDVNDGPVDVFGWESWEDRVAKWVYGGDDRNVKRERSYFVLQLAWEPTIGRKADGVLAHCILADFNILCFDCSRVASCGTRPSWRDCALGIDYSLPGNVAIMEFLPRGCIGKSSKGDANLSWTFR